MARGQKTGGRKAGTKNKLNAAVKDMILQALNEAHEDGGAAYLKEQSKNNPTAFLSLVGKLVPMDLKANVAATVTRIELVAPSDPE